MNGIIVLKARLDDYRCSKLVSADISNFPEWRNQIGDIVCNQEAGHKIFGDNRSRFREFFGKPTFIYKTSEFNFSCWLLDIGASRLLVFTAKGKGTFYEIVTHVEGKRVWTNMGEAMKFIKRIGRE